MPTEEEQAAAKAAAEAADKALEERVSKIVNSALTSHMKRVKPGLGAEELEKFLEDREAKRAEAGEAEKSKSKGGDSEVEKLRKQLEKQAKDFAEMKATAEKANAAKRDTDGRMALSQELEKGGITGQRLKHALNHLRAEGLVKFGEGDKLVFTQGEEDVDLAAGVVGWLKTDDGKHFLPPSGAGGSGSGQGGKAGTARAGTGGDSKARAAAALASHLGRGGD